MDTYNTGSSGSGSSGKSTSSSKHGSSGTTGSGTSTGSSGKGTSMGMTKKTSRNEDPVTSTIEQSTARVPSVAFLSIAIGAIAGSLGFFMAGKREVGLFMAVWVPTILILGSYNKIVKAIEDIEGGEMGSGSYSRGGSYGGGSTGF